jgi:membrane associated rhomboid family serine protease
MIPLGDVIPWRRPPLLSITVLVVSASLFALLLVAGEPRGLLLLREVALRAANPHPASFLTAIFLPAGALDLVGNLIGLWVFGSTVEDRLGRMRYLFLFFSCGIASELARVAADAGSPLPLAGLAGAVAGVLGAYFVLFPRSQVLVLVPLPFAVRVAEVPARYVLAGWFALQVVEGTRLPGGPVARAALLLALAAGFGSGAAGVVALGGRRRQSEYWEQK